MRATVSLSARHLRDTKAFTGHQQPDDAVEAIIDSYGHLVAELRQLRVRVRDFDSESAELDSITSRLRDIARLIDLL